MKKILLVMILFCGFRLCDAQNLVPNGDFEQYSGCPNGYGQLDSALSWINPSTGGTAGSPDYYNQCASGTNVGVPVNWAGFQQTHSGVAYSGIYLHISYLTNSREYIEVHLTGPLIAGACYRFEMFVNLTNGSEFTTEDIGAYFSDTAVTGINNYFPLPYTPQINNIPGNIFDTLNWTMVSSNYIATGNENYLIIGNFKDDASTNIISSGSSSSGLLYVYIDDVSLSLCTGIEEENENDAINIYPNPGSEFITINSKLFAGDEIQVTEISGKVLFIKKINSPISIFKLPTSHLSPGIYFIKTKNEVRKFVKE